MNINRGIKKTAQRIVIYGIEGIGKTELASRFPNTLFIDTEGSTNHLDVARTDAPTSWAMLMDQLIYLINNDVPNVDTLAIDTIDWAEKLATQHVCQVGNVNGIEDFGWGKGFTYVAEEMSKMLDFLTEITKKGIHVVLLAHTHIRPVSMPDDTGSYDKYEMKLSKKSAPLPKEWADAVFFCKYKVFLDGDGKKKASGGRRTCYTGHTTAFDGKNRFGLPSEIDFEGDPSKVISAITPFLHSKSEMCGNVTQASNYETKPINTTNAQQEANQKANVQAQQSNALSQKQDSLPSSIEDIPSEQLEKPTAGNPNMDGDLDAEIEAAAALLEPTSIDTGFLAPLYDLMGSEFTEEEIVAMTHRSYPGTFPQDMPLKDFSQEYINHLIAEWANVKNALLNARNK